MILSGMLGCLLHQPAKGGQHINRWVDLFVVKLPVYEYLPLGDIASEIGDRMSDIVILNNSTSTGIVRMGIWVMEPFLPETLPARS